MVSKVVTVFLFSLALCDGIGRTINEQRKCQLRHHQHRLFVGHDCDRVVVLNSVC